MVDKSKERVKVHGFYYVDCTDDEHAQHLVAKNYPGFEIEYINPIDEKE